MLSRVSYPRNAMSTWEPLLESFYLPIFWLLFRYLCMCEEPWDGWSQLENGFTKIIWSFVYTFLVEFAFVNDYFISCTSSYNAYGQILIISASSSPAAVFSSPSSCTTLGLSFYLSEYLVVNDCLSLYLNYSSRCCCKMYFFSASCRRLVWHFFDFCEVTVLLLSLVEFCGLLPNFSWVSVPPIVVLPPILLNALAPVRFSFFTFAVKSCLLFLVTWLLFISV